MDSISGLPKTDHTNYTGILVMMDAFTKFLIAFPVPRLTARAVTGAFHFAFHLYGPPKMVLIKN